MIWLILLVFVLTGLNVAQFLLLVRSANRMLRQDDALERTHDIMVEYFNDLKKMSSGGLLELHPEIVAFHKRNISALNAIRESIRMISGARSIELPTKKNLPRPEVR